MNRFVEFARGLVAGGVGTLVGASAVLYVLSRQEVIQFAGSRVFAPGDWVHWAYVNLGSSLPVFSALLLAYFVTLGQLREALKRDKAINQIVQLDHLADIWTTLFFGTGVIWTAIGMRSALLFALGDRDAALQQGAFAMLERMIDGGILLALSTTIFGGLGGYLMRVYKTLSLGSALQRRYDTAARADTSAMRASLQRIERQLQGGPARQETAAPAAGDAAS